MASHSRSRRRLTSAYRYHGRHRVSTPKSGFNRRAAIASTMAVTMALYPAILGDGTGSWLTPLPPAFGEEQMPPEQRPRPIADRGEVNTEATEDAGDVVDDVSDTVDD